MTPDFRFIIRRPSCAYLLLTTALIGAASLALAPTPAWSQMYLDNVDKTNGVVDPGSGDWSASDEIWSDANGQNHAALPQGGTGILQAADTTPVTLTVVGTVRPGVLQVTAGDFTLTGDQIGTSSDIWELNAGADLVLEVGATLGGTLTVAGDGTVHFTGAQADMQGVTVASGATLRSDGTTAGALQIEGRAQLDGQHEGAVMVASGGVLTGSGAIGQTLDNQGDARISGSVGQIENQGTLITTGNLTTEKLNINGGTVRVAAGHTLTATDPFGTVNSAALNVMGNLVSDLENAAGGAVTLTAGSQIDGAVQNDGTLSGSGSINGDLTNTGTVDVTAGNTLTANATTNSGALNVAGTLTSDLENAAGGTVTLTAGSQINGAVQNDGTLSGSGTISGGLTNTDTVDVASGASLNVEVGTFTNRGRVSVAGDLVVTDGLTNNSGGRLALDGGTVTGAVNSRAGSRIEIASDSRIAGNLTNAGRLDVTGTADARLDVTGHTLTHSGNITSSGGGRLTLAADQLILQGSAVDTATVGLEGAITNRAQLNVSGDLVLTGDLVNEAGGVTNVTALLDADGFNVTNHGRLEVASGGEMQDIATLTNTNILTISDGAKVSADSIANNGGTLTLAGDLTGKLTNEATVNLTGGTLTGDLTNAAGGTVTLTAGSRIDGAVQNDGTLTGTATITGDLTNSGTATLAGSTGAIENSGTLTTGGDLTATTVTNDGTVNITAGNTLTADSTTNRNALNVAGTLDSDLTNAAGGTVTLTAGSRIDGAVQNDGTLTGTATITGDLTNSGTATLAGSTGAIENSGTLTTGGDLTATTVTNDGTVNITAGNTLTADSTTNRNALNVAGTLDSDLTNAAGGTVTLTAGGQMNGSVSNDGGLLALQGGGIAGNVLNRRAGSVEISGDTAITGNMNNRGSLDMTSTTQDVRLSVTGGTFTNSGTITESGGRNLTISADSIVLQSSSDVTDINLLGDILNEGRLTYTRDSSLGGNLTNTADGTVNISASLDAGGNDITNLGAMNITSGALAGVGALENGGVLTVDDGSAVQAASATNLSGGEMVLSGGLTASVLDNQAGATVLLNGQMTGNLSNAGSLSGGGTVTGDLTNSGQMAWSGDIGGDLTSSGTADLAGTIAGGLRNQGNLTTTDDLTVTGGIVNTGNTATMSIADATVLSASGGVLNEAGATLTNAGRIRGNLDSYGSYEQVGVLEGSLVARGNTALGGQVTGDVSLVAGTLDAADGLNIGGTLSLAQDFTVVSGQSLQAGATTIANTAALTLAGVLNSDTQNDGRIVVRGSSGQISGELVNNGTVSMSGDGDVSGVMTVAALSGTGNYQLDVNLAQMESDQIVVSGGAAQGHMMLILNGVDASRPLSDSRVTLVQVDDAFSAENTFTYDYSSDFSSSERIVYSLDQAAAGGSLDLVSQTNPAIGAIFGNVALTQSLIGSVVNRPTSPFVTGLAVQDDENPCGTGIWGRTTGGHATATGATDNGVSKVDSRINANYYGLQFGGDVACFDGRHGGWNTAFGVLGGVNTGRTSQPVYTIDGRISQQVTDQISSINRADFTQAYGGVYMTGTRGNWMVDLQYRYENTRFSMTNTAIGGGEGLGLRDAKFNNKAHTLSGAVSYGFAFGEDSSWALIPTAGFAWSQLSTDRISFSDGYQLSFEDSNRKIGFAGATLAKTFAHPQDESALGTYLTATYYKDFADPTVSVFSHQSDTSFEPQRLVSDNLGAYGEISIGATWVKVLGSGARARQFSASSRIDARFGDGLDSVGVTGQVRWQF
ncbi:MAG: hypothetical protein Q4G24_15355 [Paracoccus sp. (in: a-proteobacteria)]|uniref:hypothetical protein n=1 Tax=Paracoccus sp. TaxID=267 RepID=UPI0026E05CEB|nr:hypothetical protein [Paracoccus sp. (in: a-proteobacteria)]MDO5622825.1 hypothetical protein [Paracoccus sp. (in: a-proteobacteria)]